MTTYSVCRVLSVNKWQLSDEFVDYENGRTWNLKMPGHVFKGYGKYLVINEKLSLLVEKWQLTLYSGFWVWINDNFRRIRRF